MNTAAATAATSIATAEPTFLMFMECHRCAGYKRAFEHHYRVNGGRCLACNGTLRTTVTKPLSRLTEFYPDARARSISTLARVLELTGAKRETDANGKTVSAWGFVQHRKGDNEAMAVAALSIAPADVRARFWRAFSAKVRATMPEKGDAPMTFIKRKVCETTGITEGEVGAWLGETQG